MWPIWIIPGAIVSFVSITQNVFVAILTKVNNNNNNYNIQ